MAGTVKRSPSNAKKVLALLASRFPGSPIKAVISTTDSLWHFAGIRPYVARGIPIYALDLSLPLPRSFLAAPHTFRPDALALHPCIADLHAVFGKTRIGSGNAIVDMYPIRGHGDERMLMVYFPKQRLLYGSSNDVVTRDGETLGTFNLPEIVTAVRRLGLSVRTYVAIHTPELPWLAVTEAATKPALH